MNLFSHRLFLLVIPPLLGAWLWYFSFIPDLAIWPGHKHMGYYSDSMTADHGNSTITLLPSDSTQLRFEYRLGQKHTFPYIGVTFETDDDTVYYDVSPYDEIVVDIEVQNSRRIPVVVNEALLNYSNPQDPLSYRPVTKELECSRGRNSYALNLSEFYVPP
ncbi:MAG: hypothetical protein K2Q22_04540, partial [Cytophagales bacterium]|nr:hypothetical protein [Cytophagales bacterium]